MALQNTNTNWMHGSYEADRSYHIKQKENADLANGVATAVPVDVDSAGRLFIGYGFDFEARTADQVVTALRGILGQEAISNYQRDILNAYLESQEFAIETESGTESRIPTRLDMSVGRLFETREGVI